MSFLIPVFLEALLAARTFSRQLLALAQKALGWTLPHGAEAVHGSFPVGLQVRHECINQLYHTALNQHCRYSHSKPLLAISDGADLEVACCLVSRHVRFDFWKGLVSGEVPVLFQGCF